MKCRQFQTIHARIFLSFSLVIAVFILCALLLFGLTFSNTLLQKEYATLSATCADASASIDEEFTTIRKIGARIYTSNQFKDLFFKPITSDTDAFLTGRELWQTVRTVTGAVSAYPRILCQRYDGACYKLGDTVSYDADGATTLAPDILSWGAQAAEVPEGISEPTWIHPESGIPKRWVLTYYTRFSRKLSTQKDNLLAISLDYNQIFQRTAALQEKSDRKIYVFSPAGTLLFPREEADMENSVLRALFTRAKAQESASGILSAKVKSREICAYQYSEVTGFLTLAVVPKATVNAPIQLFYFQLFSLGLGVVFLAVFLAYAMAKRLVIPLNLLKESIKAYDLDTTLPEVDSPLGSGIGEVEALYEEYMRMRHRVQSSLSEAIVAKNHETQSRLLALQAQMNPHFLYNTLAVMGILAEEGANTELSEMCALLSGMLRYISSDSSRAVPLRAELAHTKAYVRLMQIRYREMLCFSCEIPDALLDLLAPRLILQPLVENALKYGIDVEPPWHISIFGTLEAERWKLRVKDSGTGFPEERRRELLAKMHSLDIHTYVPDASLSGMGLINIYMRLGLLYGEALTFQLENAPEGGACVTIGGRIHGKQFEMRSH